jgi:3-dehydroquinate dehydratase-2
MEKILVLHGPNLNLLGLREPMLYGHKNLDYLNERLKIEAESHGFILIAQQSNSESELIDAVQNSITNNIDYIIINPAAYTHTSIALRDAFLCVGVPFIEVHISNIFAREPFREKSYFSDIAIGVISGFGIDSYFLAINAISNLLKRENN